jgi:crossover junction endodeoxyribonuclease RuvC
VAEVRLIAIDPGAISGAAAFFFESGSLVLTDIPVADKQVDAAEFARLLRVHKVKAAVVERVASMPKQGVASTFKFGMGVGIIHGVLLAHGVPVNLVTPGVWKKHFNLGPDKEQARGLAKRLYPGIQGMERKKDAGRAEALLLGHYWMEKHP